MAKVIQLRGLVVQHHMIVDGEDVHLIDGGFIGGISRIEKALARLGKDFSNVRSIILSHGHLDHTLNVARLQKLTGAIVFAPQVDRDHLEGRHSYQGWSRICGWFENTGRLLLSFKPPAIDQWFIDGEDVMGMTVISLPGHTVGHCGFLLTNEKILLAGDLFTNHFGRPTPPPRAFNDNHEEARRSIVKAAKLDLQGVFLNHSWKTTPEEALLALIDLANDL